MMNDLMGNKIPINGLEFVNKKITLAQFAILKLLQRYDVEGASESELIKMVKVLYDHFPIPKLIFDDEDIIATCTQLILKGWVLRKKNKNTLTITRGGVNFLKTLTLVGCCIETIIPKQVLVEAQQDKCFVVKIS
jgi:hypothetical protein